jgi:hypothetical protein
MENLKFLREEAKKLKHPSPKGRKPTKRKKGYSRHSSGLWVVKIRSLYLGYHLKYFKTEKEAFDCVTDIYTKAGCIGSKYQSATPK